MPATRRTGRSRALGRIEAAVMLRIADGQAANLRANRTAFVPRIEEAFRQG